MMTRISLVAIFLWACGDSPGGGLVTGGTRAADGDASEAAGGQTEPPPTGDARAPGDDANVADAPAASPICDPGPVLATCVACHGPQRAEGGLDLTPDDLAGRLVGVPSARCPAKLLVDPEAPEDSLLLALVDPERHSALAGCALALMPPGSNGLAADQVECLSGWVHGLAADGPPEPPPAAEALGLDSYLAKLKTVLTGEAPTAEERTRVAQNGATLRPLVAEWLETPAFEAKLGPFLQTALQQDMVGTLNEQLDKPRGRPARIRALHANAAESFARTALRIVREGRPFTEILTTREWEVTTAVAIALAYTDQNAAARAVNHSLVRLAPAGAPRPVTVEWMVANRTWVETTIPADCRFGAQLDADPLLDFLIGLVRCAGAGQAYRFDNPLLLESDFTDWHTLTLNNASAENPTIPFYDLPGLRAATTLPLHIPRAGFFTTPAFLANFPTNDDNRFRVTTNQALIVALQSTFNAADPTESFGGPAIDTLHAAPDTDCYGCHKLLDPMRVAFWDAFTPIYQRAEARTDYEGHFAFEGYRSEEATQSPIPLGRALAAHPRFKTAWVQRVCYWVNSQACDEADPRFQQIADAFEASAFNFKAMLADLFASPLVTIAEPPAAGRPAPPVSITRANHLCPLIEARLEDPTLCDGMGASLGLIPHDEFSRGDTIPALTASPSTFGFAAAEAFCQRVANRLVGPAAEQRPLSVEDVPGSLAILVERLMGLNAAHPRHDAMLVGLQAHFDEARATPGGSVPTALRSAAILACLSPDVMGVGL